MLGALWRIVCGVSALGLQPLASILDLRLDAGEVHTAQGDEHLMSVQHGLQRDRHRSLWQWHCGCFWLRWSWLVRCLSLAVRGAFELRLEQLLCPSGNRRAQTMLAEVVRRLLIVAAVTVPVDDVVGRGAVALAGNLR